MVRFIDQHRDTYGFEPICALVPIAPSTHDTSIRALRIPRIVITPSTPS